MRAQTHAAPWEKQKSGKFLSALTISHWLITVCLSIVFYIAVRRNWEGTDGLACLLLAMVILGWIMLARYSPSMEQKDRHL